MASAFWYLQAIPGQWGGGTSPAAARRVDWPNDTITVSLHTATYVPDQDTHDFFSDATNEISGGNYARQVLGTKSVAIDQATNAVQLRAANTTFTNLTNTFRYALVWKDTGSAATSPLMGYVDCGAQTVTAAPFVLDWNDVDGVLKGTVG